MRKSMMCLVLLLAGCGGEVEVELERAPAPATGVSRIEATEQEVPEAPAGEPAAAPGVQVPVCGAQTLCGSGFGAIEGRTVHAAKAFMSCGYWISGKGTASVAAGGFALSFVEESPMGVPDELFVFVDGDGDGLCDVDKGDSVWKTDEDGRSTGVVTPGSLSPLEGWYCLFFNGY